MNLTENDKAKVRRLIRQERSRLYQDLTAEEYDDHDFEMLRQRQYATAVNELRALEDKLLT